MTDTKDWKPSEEMIEATWILGYLDMRTHPGTVEIIKAVRPLIIAEEQPKIEQAERKKHLSFGFASYKDGTFELIAENPNGEQVMLSGKLEQPLEKVDRVFPTCVFVPGVGDLKEKIEAAERERIAKYFEDKYLTTSSMSLAEEIRALKDSKP